MVAKCAVCSSTGNLNNIISVSNGGTTKRADKYTNVASIALAKV